MLERHLLMASQYMMFLQGGRRNFSPDNSSPSIFRINFYIFSSLLLCRGVHILSWPASVASLLSVPRSPSPEPFYSSDGKRLNTREYRKRKALEELRHDSIQRMVALNVEYRPPPDYK